MREYRTIGVYYPTKLDHGKFRRRAKLIVAAAWVLSFAPMIPTGFGAMGLYGLECKTRKCTPININPDGTPSFVNPKSALGSNVVIVAIVLLVSFNAAIYYRLWVKYIITFV